MIKNYVKILMFLVGTLFIVSCSGSFDEPSDGILTATGRTCDYDKEVVAEQYRRCAGCHGPEGDVSALGVSRPIAHMPADELYDVLRQYKEGTLNQYNLGGIMKGQTALYSDEEIKDLSCFISEM